MFENIVSNLKNKSFRVSDSLSVESLKGKTYRFSETLCNIGSSFIHKTNSLSSYLSVDQFNKKDAIVNDEYAKTSMSTPNLVHNIPNGIQSEMRWPTVINNKTDYVIYNPMAEDEYDDDDDIVNRFVRVINVEEETPPHRRYARRNDREEIRRRLATGCDTDEYYGGDRPGRKPSLQARLQSGMNLQICFMNDTMSDTESPSSDTEPPSANTTPSKQPAPAQPPPPPPPPPEKQTQHTINASNKCTRGGLTLPLNQSNEVQTEADFFAKQARLQAEARIALAQAKDMARLQMEVERQRRQTSPITDMLRATLHKVGIVFPQDRRRVSRQMLTDMNVAQLQVIVNDLHTQIEYLNESLVKFLMERDDLHMGQDSMLVDIEDLTRYLGAKENTLKEDFSHNNNVILSKPKLNRIAGLVRK